MTVANLARARQVSQAVDHIVGGDLLVIEGEPLTVDGVPLALQEGRIYVDRRGFKWQVISTNGQRIAPISAASWEHKDYRVRTFQRNGRYWPDRDDPWDLVAEVAP